MNKWQDYEAQAYTAMEQRDYRAAHLAFTHAIQLRQEHGDPDPPHTARLWNNVGALCRELGDMPRPNRPTIMPYSCIVP